MNKIKTKYNDLAQCKLESLSLSTALLAIYSSLATIDMKYLIFISVLSFFNFNHNDMGIFNDFFKKKTITQNEDDGYFYDLIERTGAVESIDDLTEKQWEQLKLVKSKFKELKDLSLTESLKVFNSFYDDENNISDLEINGLTLMPEENVIEIYVEHEGAYDDRNKMLTAVIIFKDWKIFGNTYVD